MAAPRYLLDTSVYSQPLRKQADLASLRRWAAVGDDACAVSAVSLAEVEWRLHKAAIPRWWMLYEQVLKPRLRHFPTDALVWTEFARMKAVQFALGRPVADFDLLIAATAVAHGLTLATHNVQHFRLIQGLVVEDWSTS